MSNFEPNPLYQLGVVSTNTDGLSINDVTPIFDAHRKANLGVLTPDDLLSEVVTSEYVADEPVEEPVEEPVVEDKPKPRTRKPPVVKDE